MNAKWSPKWSHRIARAVAGVLLPACSAMPLMAASADQVRDAEVHQEQLRTQTQRVAAQIDAVILDFQRNGLGEGQDIDTLKGIIDEYQLKGDTKSKEMNYWYGRSLEQKGDIPAAIKAYSQVAMMEFNFRDVQARIKKLRAGGTSPTA